MNLCYYIDKKLGSVSRLFAWLYNNKEWLFSGLGIAAFSAIISFLWNLRSRRIRQAEERERQPAISINKSFNSYHIHISGLATIISLLLSAILFILTILTLAIASPVNADSSYAAPPNTNKIAGAEDVQNIDSTPNPQYTATPALSSDKDGGEDEAAAPFHDLIMIATNHVSLLGDHYYSNQIESLYGNVYDSYYELLSYGGSRPMSYFTESLTDYNYARITGTVFASKNMEETQTISFQIVADSETVYDTGEINRRTRPIDFDVQLDYPETVTIQASGSSSGAYNPRVYVADLTVHKE